jgi:hypothetical protein
VSERNPYRRRLSLHPPIAFAILLLTLLANVAQAGGPKYVAGVSYFNSNVKGTPLTWTGGLINYYTDQGALSTTVAGPAADILVDQAFRHWTNISTAAVYASEAGSLAEDVNGSNLLVDSTGAITMPLDIQPAATGKHWLSFTTRTVR